MQSQQQATSVKSMMMKDTGSKAQTHLERSASPLGTMDDESAPVHLPTQTERCFSIHLENCEDDDTKEIYDPHPPEQNSKTHTSDRETVLRGILDNEKEILNNLNKIKEITDRNKRGIVKEARDIINQLYVLQTNFVYNLEKCKNTFADCSAQIIHIFCCLIERQTLLFEYKEYLHQLVEIILKDKYKNDEAHTLARGLLTKPVNWIAGTLGDIKELSSKTPPSNPDLIELEKLHDRLLTESIEKVPSVEVLSNYQANRLLMHSMVVELVNTQTNERKLRYLLLFNEVLVCAKITHRVNDLSRSRRYLRRIRDDNDGNIRIEVKWMVPLDQIRRLTTSRIKFDIEAQENEVEHLKEQIKRMHEYRGNRENEENPKLIKRESELALKTPQLVLSIWEVNGKRHDILLVTERERSRWLWEIEKAKQIYSKLRNSSPSTRFQHIRKKLRTGEMNEHLRKYQSIIQLNKRGLAATHDAKLYGVTGILRTTIHGIEKLDAVDSYHVWIETDSFGKFEDLARTRVISNQRNPKWNEIFELRVDGASTICFTIYRHSDVFAEHEVHLSNESTNGEKKTARIKTFEKDPKEIEFSFTMCRREPTKQSTSISTIRPGRIFKLSLDELIKLDYPEPDPSIQEDGKSLEIKHENKWVPKFVVACTDEIERRGLREIGLYRICGSLNEIENLKICFNQDLQNGIRHLRNADIHDITSLLKQFFADLKESLIPKDYTAELLRVAEIENEESRKHEVQKILDKLPKVNHKTFEHLMQHFTTIARYESENMMDIKNLSLMWSTVLFSTPTDTDGDDYSEKTSIQSEYFRLEQEKKTAFELAALLQMIVDMTQKEQRKSIQIIRIDQ